MNIGAIVMKLKRLHPHDRDEYPVKCSFCEHCDNCQYDHDPVICLSYKNRF